MNPSPDQKRDATSPLWGEVGPQDRVRGRKVQPAQVARAKALRRNQTMAERRLWSNLRNRALGGHKFLRQFPIGAYTADFICREKMLVIELDGGQHNGSHRDTIRTDTLNLQGYSIVRFWNNEVLQNTSGVLEAIKGILNGSPSPDLRFAQATLSPEGRGVAGAANIPIMEP